MKKIINNFIALIGVLMIFLILTGLNKDMRIKMMSYVGIGPLARAQNYEIYYDSYTKKIKLSDLIIKFFEKDMFRKVSKGDLKWIVSDELENGAQIFSAYIKGERYPSVSVIMGRRNIMYYEFINKEGKQISYQDVLNMIED